MRSFPINWLFTQILQYTMHTKASVYTGTSEHTYFLNIYDVEIIKILKGNQGES